MNLYIINGPNLNLLGLRDKKHYGTLSYQQLCTELKLKTDELNLNSTIMQSNHEGQIVEFIHEAIKLDIDALIINPAAYSHSSIAILDALECFSGYKIEVHLSAVQEREDFRKKLITANGCDEMISGQGYKGYLLAIEKVKKRLDDAK